MLLSRIGPIALESPLGGSADSNVLAGVHVERNMKMAVKLLPRHLVNRPMGGDTFAEDVKRLQKLVHPSIARYYGGAMDNGQPYLAMELVDGESLRSMLDRRGRMAWETMVDVADAVCKALHYAHQQGHVHQRLTPSRILITPIGGVKLIGFDCVLADVDDVLGLRSPMCVANYLAPEEFRGKQSASLPTCDMFSLGVILYACLTGELPWQATNPAELVQARRDAPAPRVSAKVLDCPVWLDVLVAKLLEVKREARFQSAMATHRAIVDAKQKVAEGMGAVKHAWSGKRGALATGADRAGIDQLRKKQVSSASDDSPFYERAWFLATCLAVVIGVGAWVMWPDSEDALFAKAQPLMASDDPVDWRRAQEQYLSELRERFPDTKHADAIAEFERRYAIHRAEQRIRNIELRGAMPRSEIERQYLHAWRFERFGDPLSAWVAYEALVEAYPSSDDADDQGYLDLARQRIAGLKNPAETDENVAEIVDHKLDQAASMAKEGNLLGARRLLRSIIELYEGNRDLAPLMDRAREQLKELDSQDDEERSPAAPKSDRRAKN